MLFHPFPPKPCVDATLLQNNPSTFTVKNRKGSEVYFISTDYGHLGILITIKQSIKIIIP